jgi:ferredoxin--NADP+ reductase
VQALTREKKDGILLGRIPQLLEDGTLEKYLGWPLAADNSAVLLCGNPAMLDDMESKLGKRQMKKHRTKDPGQIVVERYW